MVGERLPMEPISEWSSPTIRGMAIAEFTIEVISDTDAVLAAGHLFDHPPTSALAARFLSNPGHHLLLASVDGIPVGFVTGIEINHPDKRTEMLLYELAVDIEWRRRGIGTGLVSALCALARESGHRGMWVPIDAGDAAAAAVYRAAGASVSEAAEILEWEF